MIGHNYLMLGMALVLLVTNCLGAAFTIRRIRFRERKSDEPTAIGHPASRFAHK